MSEASRIAATFFPEEEPLWPGEIPGWRDTEHEETWEERDTELNALGINRALKYISIPCVQAYLPPRHLATGVAVVIYPGGGFVHLAIDKEGYDVATWLNTLGIAGMVVRYRTAPDTEERQEVIPSAEMDARRAVQLARSRSSEWGLDPSKIGVMGFSAGGFLAAAVGTEWDSGDARAEDPVMRVSSRPDFMCLMYSGGRDHHRERITKETPPTFLAQAADDFLPVERTISFCQTLLGNGVHAEMHVFGFGGHGFGLGVNRGSVAAWPGLFAEWLEGVFRFRMLEAQRRPGLSIESCIEEILADERGKAVLGRYLPGFFDGQRMEMAMRMSLPQIASFAPQGLSQDVLTAIDEELAKL